MTEKSIVLLRIALGRFQSFTPHLLIITRIKEKVETAS